MKRFGYWRDPLCVACCLLYAANRWAIKPHFHFRFSHSWFNDALLIPCALPLALWIQRRLQLRTHDAPPTATEVAAHLVGWSVLFELVGPRIVRHATGDIWDVVAYSAGAVSAIFVWRWFHRGFRHPATKIGPLPPAVS